MRAADIDDAVFTGASAGRGNDPAEKPTPSDGAISRFRHRLVAFLRAVEDELTVADLLEELDPVDERELLSGGDLADGASS